MTFDQLLLIFNPNLGVDFRGQLFLRCKMKFDNFGLSGKNLIIIFLFICEFLDLDIIWLVNFMILT